MQKVIRQSYTLSGLKSSGPPRISHHVQHNKFSTSERAIDDRKSVKYVIKEVREVFTIAKNIT